LISGLIDGSSKRRIEFGNARSKQILKTDEQWELDSLLLQVLYDPVEIDVDGITKNWPDRKMSVLIDAEI
jgi:hypothetical protein